MNRIRIQRPKVRRDRSRLAVLPLDPRDPAILRAKARRSSAVPHQEVTSN
jgi:hypothetical protein